MVLHIFHLLNLLFGKFIESKNGKIYENIYSVLSRRSILKEQKLLMAIAQVVVFQLPLKIKTSTLQVFLTATYQRCSEAAAGIL